MNGRDVVASARPETEGVSWFYAAIGDRNLADTVLQNFRQTICFRTEDRGTIERMHFLSALTMPPVFVEARRPSEI